MGSNCKLHSDRGVQKLLQDLDQLLHESKSADTVFFVGVKEVPMPCHSFMLKQRCKNYRSDQQRFPSTSPELFQLFLNYVYTGRLAVEESCLLDLLCLAAEFGMEDLEETCEQLIYGCTDGSPSKACSVLTSALGKKRKVAAGRPRSLQAIITHCTRLIGESPAELFQSPKFLSIPSDTLISIISSDQLCLEEEQIWRYVLKWAQYNAGVDTPLREWSEEERLQVAKYLSPVIGHVRLLLIDSRIFAEEVEPTGCVPMALSLERYRFAALQAPLTTTGTLHAIPRKAPKLFQSSLIIHSTGLAAKLNEWYAQAATVSSMTATSWKCIYRASLHGFSADAFHKHCDGHSPTYVIVQIAGNCSASGGATAAICGGYTDVAWSRPRMPKYVASSKSFLFSYAPGASGPGSAHATTAEPVRFKIQRKHFAVCHHDESGPIFGAGSDLYIASNCDTPAAESYSNIGHTYAVAPEDIPMPPMPSVPPPPARPPMTAPGQGNEPPILSNGTLTRKTPGLGAGAGLPSSQFRQPPTLAPTYNFVVADYEVFVPFPGSTSGPAGGMEDPEYASIGSVSVVNVPPHHRPNVHTHAQVNGNGNGIGQGMAGNGCNNNKSNGYN